MDEIKVYPSVKSSCPAALGRPRYLGGPLAKGMPSHPPQYPYNMLYCFKKNVKEPNFDVDVRDSRWKNIEHYIDKL